MKREMQRDRETLQDRKQMFGREVRNYRLEEDTELSKWNRLRIIGVCRAALYDLRK
ncbi:MAG: hypothetical protein IKO61_06470 [Lachnospiraceae bacterium]|nr:hypothetical protein [Lachnospiraceae bacterium]